TPGTGNTGGSGSDTGTGGSSNPGSGTTGSPPQLSADEAFVQALYKDALHRTGSLAELDGWVAALPGLGRAGAAAQIVRSGEALRSVIADVYLTYLNRAPDSDRQAAWLAFLQNGR